MISRRNLTLVVALSLVVGAAGVVVASKMASEVTVKVTPTIDLGDGQALTVKEFDDRLDYALELAEFNSPGMDELRERDPEGFAKASEAEEPEALYEWAAEVRQAIWTEKHGKPFELRGR